MSNNETGRGSVVGIDAHSYANGIEYPQPFDEYAIALGASARRHIYILSPQLDHEAFDTAGLADALSALARSSRQSDIRILVSDIQPMVTRGHGLLELARRLPSKVHIQRLAEHPQWQGENCVIRDRSGVLALPGGAESGAFFEPDSRARATQYLELFQTLWNSSAPDPALRALYI